MNIVNLPTNVTVGSVVVLVLVLLFWAFLAWLKQRNLTAATKVGPSKLNVRQLFRARTVAVRGVS